MVNIVRGQVICLDVLDVTTWRGIPDDVRSIHEASGPAWTRRAASPLAVTRSTTSGRQRVTSPIVSTVSFMLVVYRKDVGQDNRDRIKVQSAMR